MKSTGIRRTLAGLGWGAAVATLTALSAGCQSDRGGGGRGEARHGRSGPVAMVAHVNGEDPALRDPNLRLITTQEEFNRLGSDELRRLTPDFGRESLVLLSLGERPTGGYWTHVRRLDREGDDLWVYGTVNRPASDETVSQGASYPYEAVVIAKVPATTRLRNGIESVTGRVRPSDEASSGRETLPMPAEGGMSPAGEEGGMTPPASPMSPTPPTPPAAPTPAAPPAAPADDATGGASMVAPESGSGGDRTAPVTDEMSQMSEDRPATGGATPASPTPATKPATDIPNLIDEPTK